MASSTDEAVSRLFQTDFSLVSQNENDCAQWHHELLPAQERL